jgi:type I restriction enzyme, S subunit
MTTDLLFKNFHLLADTPGKVKKLRQLILQLAVQGRLVPQNPDDQPASEVLHQIKKEKQRLIKEGKIKKQKPLPEIRPEEVPYELPQGWEWAYLQDLFAVITDGDHQAPPKADRGIPFLVIGNLNMGKISFDGCRYVLPDYYESLDWSRKPSENDILYTVTGSYGIPVLVTQNKEFCVQRHVAIFKSLKSTPVKYLVCILGSAYAFDYSTSVATGIAQKTVPLSGLRKMPVPIPPLPEQHRIVAKVDQLMALCDELEARQEKQRTAHARLNKSALHALTQSRTRDEMTFNWTRIKDNFSLVFTTPESTQELRSSILHLAVQGRLVPQNPDDEPASVLLEKIREEKKQLIKECNIKKQKPLPEIIPEEVPFELPQGWEWVRLGMIVDKIHYGYTASADHDLTTPKMLRITDIQDNRVDWETVPGCQIDQANLNRYALQNGDILIARTGGTIGKSFLVPAIDVDAVFASYLIRIVPGKVCFPRFIKTFFESPTYWDQLYEKSMGTGQPNVNGTALRLLIVPFPSLPEQHRIVAKVDQLMDLCDELEANLTLSQKDGQKLMQSVVAGMSEQNMMKDSMSMVKANNRLIASSGFSG